MKPLQFSCGLVPKSFTQSTLANPSTNGCQGLTFERLRICELLVELLNCSNMSLLNRRRGSGGPEYDDEGHLQGGLAALEQLAHAVSSGKNGEGEDWQGESGENEMEPAKEMPVSGSSRPLMPHSSPSFNSEDSFSEGDDAVSSDGSVDDISIDVDNSVGSLGPLNGSEELSRSTSSKRSRSARISNGSTSREISRSRSDVRMRSASEPGSRSCADRYKFHMVHAQLLPVMLASQFGVAAHALGSHRFL
jgi:serine/threonine-protein phosphatase 6 regulatory subunit 3